ncbi:hypothetical protein PROPEN_01127 [Proteus penneri ATCC 35198]|nr:hypothetical protein PROPEN_01127 [Proteus penneri ATCC 35198]
MTGRRSEHSAVRGSSAVVVVLSCNNIFKEPSPLANKFNR